MSIEESDRHLNSFRVLFGRLSRAKLTINLAKKEFYHAIAFSGHGQVNTVEAKVKAISDFPVPACKDN